MCIIPPEGIKIANSSLYTNLYELGENILTDEELNDFFNSFLEKMKSVEKLEVKFCDVADWDSYMKYVKVLIPIWHEKSGYTSFITYLLDFSKLLKTLGDERFNELIEFIDSYIHNWFAYDPEIHSQYRYADGRRVLKKDAMGIRPPTKEELIEFNSLVYSKGNKMWQVNHPDQT